MTAPRKPTEPTPPEERIIVLEIKASVYYGEETPEQLLKQALSQYKNEYYKNLVVSGDWKISSIKRENGYNDIEVVVSFMGGEISYDNPGYGWQIGEYQKAVKSYPAKLAKYNKDKIEYDKWKVANDKKVAEQKVINLQKQIEKAQKELKKLKV